MLRCPCCGEEHDLLDPTFRRPDAFVALAAEHREHARADDDCCVIELPGAAQRSFVRCVLPVAITGSAEQILWGVWAELEAPDFQRVIEARGGDGSQCEPPFHGALANDITGHAGTIGLPLIVFARCVRSASTTRSLVPCAPPAVWTGPA